MRTGAHGRAGKHWTFRGHSANPLMICLRQHSLTKGVPQL